MGSDLHFAIPEAENRRANDVYTALREALKLKKKVENVLASATYASYEEKDAVREFISALEEAEKAMTRPLFG